MSKEVLLHMSTPVRRGFDIPHHDIGPREQPPRIALIAGLHGNELNGTFVLSRLAALLNRSEAGDHPKYRLHGRVIIVPAVNVLGMNTGTRLWPFDGTDINRMFPGYAAGETTQRIAHAVLEATRSAYYRVDLHSSNKDFEELPQVRLYQPSDDERASAFLFGLPAIVERPINEVVTSTVDHAWRGHPGENFVLQAGQAGFLQLQHCERMFQALISFLRHAEVLSGEAPYQPEEDVHLFGPEQSLPVISGGAGLFVSHMAVGRWVQAGETVGYLYDGYSGETLDEIKAPIAGLLSGIRRQPLLCEGDLVARIQTPRPVDERLDTYLVSQGQ